MTREAVITGGREYFPSSAELEECAGVLVEHRIEVVVHGAARGVDSTVGAWLMKRGGFEVAEMPADWSKHGRAAGPLRNEAMLSRQGVVVVIAFPGGRGTRHCIGEAKRRGVPVHFIGRAPACAAGPERGDSEDGR